MTKHRRTRMYIERNRKLREAKRAAKYKDNDSLSSVITTQHFIEALIKCRKGVSWKGSVQVYTANAIVQIHNAREQLLTAKLPELSSVRQSDRMIQRVLCDHSLVPIIKDVLIYDNGASMKGKGVDFSRQRLLHHLYGAIKEYGSNFYALTFDFKGYFDSIPHSTCRTVLEKYFKDEDIRELTMGIIKSYQKSTIKQIRNKEERERQLALLNDDQLNGITLGSQVSQVMALVVPNKLDHYIKDKLGVKHYIRYMDDGIILSNDKEYLHELYEKMKVICDELGLKFNDKKTHIVKVSRGFTFMKVRYRVTETGKVVKTLAKSGTVRMRRKMKKFKHLVEDGSMTMDDVYNSVQSWFAHSYIANAYHARKNMTKLYNELFDGYKLTKKYKHVKGGKNGELLQADKWQEFRWSCDAA